MAAITILALAIAAQMHRWLFYGGVPVTFRGENVPEINYIWLIRQQMEAGHPLTLWLPKFIGGEAVATHAAYPLYWGMALISLLLRGSVEQVYIGAEFVLFLVGALGTFALVRRLTRNLAAGIVAGAIFSLIPAHLNAIEGFYLQCSWMLIPWLFWQIEVRCTSEQPLRARDAVAPGILIGILLLLSIQMPMMMFPYLAIYWLLREWQSWSSDTSPLRSQGWWRAHGRIWVLSGLIGVGISLSYYLPTALELFNLGWSRYVNDELGVTVDLSFLWFMLSYRWSSEMTTLRWHHISWYLGGLAIGLALFGWMSWIRKRIAWIYFVFALLSLLLLVGESLGSIPNWVYRGVEALPLLNGVLRRSFRFVLPFSLAISVLAGFGIESLLRWTRIKTLGMMLLIAAVVSGAVLTDYWLHRGNFRVMESYLEPDRAALVDWLNQQPNTDRYLIPFEYGLTADGYLRGYHVAAMHHLLERPGIWDDSFVGHYASRRADELIQACIVTHPLWAKSITPILAAMLDLANVRYYILNGDVNEQKELLTAFQASEMPQVFSQGTLNIFENPDVRPFVQFYAAAVRYAGGNLAGEFQEWLPLTNQRNLALFDGEPSTMNSTTQSIANVQLLAEIASIAQPEGQSTWQRSAPNQIEVESTFTEPVNLVVAEAWFPGWQVWVDGVQKPLLRANYAFMGVQLDAGQHTVKFRYSPPWYTWFGWGVAALVWLFAALLFSRTVGQ
ncbi:MAG: YfhO family protein [Caldilineaceae bacterium]